jgi:hypothetical protein
MAKASSIPCASLSLPKAWFTASDLLSTTVVLGIAIANNHREIDEIEQTPEIAQERYLAAMRLLRVPMPAQPFNQVNKSQTTAHGYAPAPPAASVQTNTTKNCEPVWQSRTSYILVPTMVGYNSAGEAVYDYIYKSVSNPVAVIPSGC